MTDPVIVDDSSARNRYSYLQWVPQNSLSEGGHNISRSMSLHLHSTFRRIFVGPTPVNWNYKKKSFWFSKSERAVHHGSRRKKTFRAATDVIGTTNMSSLDYNVSDDRCEEQNIISDTPFLVEEPQELEIIESDTERSIMNREIFYTPTEDINSFSVTPPHNPRLFNSKKKSQLQSLSLNLQILQQNVKSPEENDNVSVPSTNSSKYSINHDEINDRGFNAYNDVECSKSFISAESEFFKTPVCESGIVLKEDRVLIRIERVYHSGAPRIYNYSTSKKYLTYSIGWREYNVKLTSDKVEFYKSKASLTLSFLFQDFCKNLLQSNYILTSLILQGKLVDKLSFSSSTRLCLYSSVDYTIALSDPCDYGMKVFIFRPKTYALSIEWYRALYNLLRPPSIKPVPPICDVVVPDLNVRVQIPLEDRMQAFKITAEEITKTVLDELSGINEWEDVLNEWLKNSDIRLCWKSYDRIEWIVWEKNDNEKDRNDLLACPQFIEGTHQLQLRCTQHYPTSVTLPDETKLQEPPPVEGYLIRDEKLNKKRPLIYAVAPHVQGQEHSAAFIKADIKRRAKQILNAYGFINLIDIVEVKPLINDNNEGTCENENFEDISKEHKSEGKGCPFELVMSNGMTIILEAYSKITMKEWVKCLNALVKYWKARLADDIKIRISMLKSNQFNDYDDNGVHIGDDFHGHWDSFRSYTSTTIWHWCILNGCRGIMKSGLLYQKARFYGTFINYYHILTRGYLIFYQLQSWSIVGRKNRRSYHRQKGIINLLDCYIYSGHLTDHDLPHSSTSHKLGNEVLYLPRIYSDGMCCFDDDDECTFVVWQGNKHHVIKRHGTIGLELQKKTTLDSSGKAWIFRARNRIEREEWVWALNVEIERCLMEQKGDAE
ncbi:7854_t:CDS:2 [Cetraspora pellucida]|uniref:7854_t:CDS:1 n=1 Tax=Cetraspora pellucida TaxID=1433469 RepID=A0A9N9FRT9_9GLOM|nr:7854_t:CDS:2 [Cetraspora pellucida]